MENDLHGGNFSSLSQRQPLLHQRKKTNASRAMEWLGRTTTSGKPGGWRSALFILGASSFSAVANSAIFCNLVIYLKSVWNLSTAGAAVSVTNLSGSIFFTSIIGGFLGDAYLGRHCGTMLFQAIMLLGCTSFTLVATVRSKALQNNPSSASRSFMFVSLYLMVFGNGSLQPTLIASAADQFDAPQDKARILNLYVISGSVMNIVSLTVLSYVETSGRWILGFWIATAGAGISILMSVAGAPFSRQYTASGNPLLRIVQVFVAAARKTNTKMPTDTSLLYEVGGEESAIPGTRKLVHTGNLRCLDKAAIIREEDYEVSGEATPNRWRLCTVTQVEEVKCLGRTLPFTLMAIFYAGVVIQTGTIFVEQGETMDRHMGVGSFEVPSSSMQLFGTVSSAIFVGVYEAWMVKWLRRRTGHAKGLTSLQRVGAGFGLAVGAMVAAGVVERVRLGKALQQQISDGDESEVVEFSIFWLVPQYVMLGVAENCAGTGYLDLYYSEISDGMRSLGISILLMVYGLGNYASSVLVSSCNAITSSRGQPGWIPDDLNQGHLDYFYWLCAGIMALDLLAHVFVSRRFSYLQAQDP